MNSCKKLTSYNTILVNPEILHELDPLENKISFPDEPLVIFKYRLRIYY